MFGRVLNPQGKSFSQATQNKPLSPRRTSSHSKTLVSIFPSNLNHNQAHQKISMIKW